MLRMRAAMLTVTSEPAGDLVGRIDDRGQAECVSACEWMRICFELLEMRKPHKKGASSLSDLFCPDHLRAAAAPSFPNCCFWAELTARSACSCRCLCWFRTASRDIGRLVGGRLRVAQFAAQRYAPFCFPICFAPIIFAMLLLLLRIFPELLLLG